MTTSFIPTFHAAPQPRRTAGCVTERVARARATTRAHTDATQATRKERSEDRGHPPTIGD